MQFNYTLRISMEKTTHKHNLRCIHTHSIIHTSKVTDKSLQVQQYRKSYIKISRFNVEPLHTHTHNQTFLLIWMNLDVQIHIKIEKCKLVQTYTHSSTYTQHTYNKIPSEIQFYLQAIVYTNIQTHTETLTHKLTYKYIHKLIESNI